MDKEKFNLSVEICKRLPFDITILADKRGCCTKDKPNCPYYRFNLDSKLQLCYKKNIDPILPLIRDLS